MGGRSGLSKPEWKKRCRTLEFHRPYPKTSELRTSGQVCKTIKDMERKKKTAISGQTELGLVFSLPDSEEHRYYKACGSSACSDWARCPHQTLTKKRLNTIRCGWKHADGSLCLALFSLEANGNRNFNKHLKKHTKAPHDALSDAELIDESDGEEAAAAMASGAGIRSRTFRSASKRPAGPARSRGASSRVRLPSAGDDQEEDEDLEDEEEEDEEEETAPAAAQEEQGDGYGMDVVVHGPATARRAAPAGSRLVVPAAVPSVSRSVSPTPGRPARARRDLNPAATDVAPRPKPAAAGSRRASQSLLPAVPSIADDDDTRGAAALPTPSLKRKRSASGPRGPGLLRATPPTPLAPQKRGRLSNVSFDEVHAFTVTDMLSSHGGSPAQDLAADWISPHLEDMLYHVPVVHDHDVDLFWPPEPAPPFSVFSTPTGYGSRVPRLPHHFVKSH